VSRRVKKPQSREDCSQIKPRKLLIINQAHLRRVMREFVTYHNSARPHQGLDQQIPVGSTASSGSGPVRCRTVLGGILHDYYREAA
jgi:hypothetical protein